MGLLPSRSMEICISNKSQNIALKNPRIYFYCGHCPHSSLPELSPGSSGICYFLGNSWGLWGVSGVLVYEAESFTLAIYFSNPIDYSTSSMELGLELSPGKAHLDWLPSTYTRMASGTYSASDADIKFSRGIVDWIHSTVQVSDGPVKVTATMTDDNNSVLSVVLEEQVEWGGSRDRQPQSKEKHPGEDTTCRIPIDISQENLELDG